MKDENITSKKQIRRWRETGNAVVMLFAAIGMAGVVTYGLNNVMRGPGVMTAEVSRKTIAENNLVASTRLAISAATTSQGNSGDCDSDGFVEPVPFRAAGVAPAPVGGGLLPMTIGASMTDPWGAQYGYCVWDAGTVRKTDAHAGCGGAGANRLNGGPKDNQPAIAVISAGKNGAFETACNAYVDTTPADGKPDTAMVNKPAGSDDVVLSYTYAEANGIGGGQWKLKTADTSTAEVGKNLEIGGGGTFSGPVELTQKGLVLPGDPGDNSITGACTAGKDKQLRRNTTTSPATLEICDFAGTGWSSISGSGTAPAIDPNFNPNTSNCTANAGGAPSLTASTALTGRTWGIWTDQYFIYVANGANGVKIYTFDGTAFTLVTTLDAPGTDDAINVWGDGTYVYVAQNTQNKIAAWYFNGTTGTFITDIAVGSNAKDVHGDGTYIYVAANSALKAYSFSGTAFTQVGTVAIDSTAVTTTGTHVITGGGGGFALKSYTFSGTVFAETSSVSITQAPTKIWYDGEYIFAALGSAGVNAYTFISGTLAVESNYDPAANVNGVWSDGVNQFMGSSDFAVTTFDGNSFTSAGTLAIPYTGGQSLAGDGNYLYGVTYNQDPGTLYAISGFRCTEPPPRRSIPDPSYTEDAVVAPPDALDSGLIARWKMNEGTGTTVADSIGAYTGTLQNTPIWNKGPNNDGSLSFDMDDQDAVQITGLMGSQVTGTISMWANMGRTDVGIPPKQSMMMSIGEYIGIGYREGFGVSSFFYQGGASWLALHSYMGLEGTGWHYITTTWDDTNNIWRLYIDGVAVSTSATVMTLTYTGMGTNTFFGRQGFGSPNFDYDGGLDDVRMWNRALSPAEVASLYKKVRKESNTRDTSTTTDFAKYKNLLAAGDGWWCAIKLDGTPWCWGLDQYEALGNGTGPATAAAIYTSPVPVSIPTGNTYYLTSTASTTPAAGVGPAGLYTKRMFSEPSVTNAGVSPVMTAVTGYNIYGVTEAGVYGKDDGGGPRSYTVTQNTTATPCIRTSVYLARVNAAGSAIQGSEVKLGSDAVLNNTTTTISGEVDLGVFAATERLQVRYNYFNTCNANATPTINFTQLSTVTVPALEYPAWTQVSAFFRDTCGLRSDGTAWCWGWDNNLQLGNGTLFTGTQATPTPVISTASRWTKLAVGGDHACGLKEDGTLWCWGDDADGQVGNGATTGQQATPVQIGAATDWVDLSSGYYHMCGLRGNGDAYCWGRDTDGQLGDTNGTATNTNAPTLLVTGGPWASLAAADNNTCGIKTDGSLWCWGDDTYEQVGQSSTSTDLLVPARIADPGPWVQVSMGNRSACAIKADSTVWCWGAAANYRLGTSETVNRATPKMLPGSQGAVAVVAGGSASMGCFMKADRSVYCWGADTYGAIGNGAVSTGDTAPTQVTGFGGKPGWTWNDAATLIKPPLNSNVGLNGTYMSTAATNDGLGYTALGKANLRQLAAPNQLLLETTAAASSVQMSFANDSNEPPPGDVLTGLGARWQFGEGAGTSAADTSGNGNTFTLTNGPTWAASPMGSAVVFDGVDDHLARTHAGSTGVNLSSQLTLMAWIKFDAIAYDDTFYTIISKASNNASSIQYRMGVNYGYLAFDFCDGASAACGTYNVAVVRDELLVPNKWYHLAVTYNSTTDDVDVFINGVARQQTNDEGDTSNANMQTSTLNFKSGYGHLADPYLDGSIDELRIYNTALTGQQIQGIYYYTLGATETAKSFTMGIDHVTDNFEIGRDVLAASNWLNAINPDIAITTTGRVGVGTASPAVKMEVAGGVKFGSEAKCAAGRDGGIRYVDGNYEYCDGATWVHLGGAGNGGGGGGGDITSGLMHRWTFDDGSGTVAVDSVGSSDTTDDSSTPFGWTGAGKIGGAIDWNSASWVSVGGLYDGYFETRGQKSFTYTFWVNLETPFGGVAFDASNSEGHVGGYITSGDLHLEMGLITGPVDQFVTGTNTLTPGTWYNIAWVHDAAADTLAIYVNGVLSSDEPVTFDFPGYDLDFGIEGDNSKEDDLRVYNRALSPAELLTIYNGGSGSGGTAQDCTGIGEGHFNDPASGNCYFYIEADHVDHTGAAAACAALDAELATPLSHTETFAIGDMLAAGGENWLWMGISDVTVEGDWKYTHGPKAGVSFWSGALAGSPVNGEFNYWNDGNDPNNSGNEDCGIIDQSGVWSDIPCGGGRGYVCQKLNPNADDLSYRAARLPTFNQTIAAGWGAGFAIRNNGTAWSWGPGFNGVLGIDDVGWTQRDRPVPMYSNTGSTGFTDWVSIEPSNYAHFSCGLRANGTAWCWGNEVAGGLGNGGADADALKPSQVIGTGGGAAYSDWVQIGGTCGVRANGTAWCWGEGSAGQVGNGASSDQTSPVIVSGGYTDWLMVSARGPNVMCGLRAGGTLWCWGNGATAAARLGDGSTNSVSNVPVQVHDTDGAATAPTNFTDWIYVTTGTNHACGLRANGLAYCWGLNTTCQLGDGTCAGSKPRPFLVTGGYTNWVSISAGTMHTCGVHADGRGYCWGHDDLGRLGDGGWAGGDTGTPNEVSDDWGTGNFTDWVSISAGDEHSCGTRVDGTAWCFGKATDGSTGNNYPSGGPFNTPVQVH